MCAEWPWVHQPSISLHHDERLGQIKQRIQIQHWCVEGLGSQATIMRDIINRELIALACDVLAASR
jgi:hypothetical protein